MDLVENKEQIIDNCKYLIKNINNINVKEIIAKGRCFLECSFCNRTYFFPSKFIGYKDNTIEEYRKEQKIHTTAQYLNNKEDIKKFMGNYANKKIQRLLNKEFKENSIFYNNYEDFCYSLGIKDNQIKYKNFKKFIILEEEIKDL